MAEQDEDYMSDKFLQNTNNPGLMPTCFINKYKRIEEGKQKGKQEKTKSLKVCAEEQRNEKLHKALDESNKGFAMLSKMGFKAGTGLGKQEQGRPDPIPLKIKEGRKGLGKESEEAICKEKKVEAYKRMTLKRKVVEESLRGDFQDRIRSKMSERQIEIDLHKNQRACLQLDNKQKFQPQYEWMWPSVKFNQREKEAEEHEHAKDNEPDNESKLKELTRYLRSVHFYCVWCGVEYHDNEDLNAHCPGNTREDHNE